MRKIGIATFAAFTVAFSCLTAQAQNDTNYGTGTCTTGSSNSAFGFQTLASCTSQSNENTAVGEVALYNNTSGSLNTAVGAAALTHDTTGSNNVAVGVVALSDITTGTYNTAVGEAALLNATTGTNNVAFGYSSMYDVVVGSGNIAIGEGAGANINRNTQTGNPVSFTTDYSNNIEIGNTGQLADSNVIRIGSGQTEFFAAGISGVQIPSGGVEVLVNSSGQLGTVNSSIRFKEDVHDMAGASDRLFQLRPVTYRYKQAYADGSKPIDYGLIAEEVAAVYPDLVARNADGQIQTVQYQKLTPMLLNELQKQHQLLEEQTATVKLLEKRLAALEAAQPSTSMLEAKLTK